MNLQKIILPEILLGRRYNTESECKQYQELMNCITFEEPGIHSTLPMHIHSDVDARNHFCLCKRYVLEKAKAYHICKDFAIALLQLQDRELPTEFLPDFFGYISFPPKTVSDDSEFVQGALVYVGIADNKTPLAIEKRGRRILWASYVTEDNGLGRILFEIKKESIAKLLESLPLTGLMKTPALELTQLILNTLLYIGSQDPVLQSLTPTFGKSHSQKKKCKVGENLNSCTVPVIAVNWDYMAPRSYQVDSTFVQTHMRWQRCGVQNSQIKLIWVSEHERHYRRING